MLKRKLLLVDDEPRIRTNLRAFLAAKGYDAVEASDCQAARAALEAERPDAAVVDFKLPDGTALDLLPHFGASSPPVPVVVLTAHGSIELAVTAIRAGAEQFLTKPVELPTLLVILERLLETQRERQKQLAERSQQARTAIDPFLGTSAAIQTLAATAAKVAQAEIPILIEGETGTGKGVLARWLHEHSARGEEALVNLNCAGLVREFLETELFGHEKGAFTGATASKQGLLEVAHRGTLFLDEIGDIDPQVQPKLLKALEEKTFRRLGEVRDRRVDLRLIAATHQQLDQLVQEKRFRSDLYFRINTLPLTVPPLRERREDIPVLAQFLLDRFAAELGRGAFTLTDSALESLQSHAWPGNIRELRNALERAALPSEKPQLTVRSFQLGAPLAGETSDYNLDLSLDEVERQHIVRILQAAGGNVEQAAQRLNIPRSSLYYKLKSHGIDLSKI